MSARKSTPAAAPESLPNSGALHAPFIARHEGQRYDWDAAFTESVMNVAQGIELALELVHSSALERLGAGQDGEARPLLGIAETDIMMRFAVEAARLLGTSAEQHLASSSDLYERGIK